MTNQPAIDVTPERLEALRAILAELDPGARKAWELEILAPGGDVITVINLKTGRRKWQKGTTRSKKHDNENNRS
jgi:hypothetical protein